VTARRPLVVENSISFKHELTTSHTYKIGDQGGVYLVKMTIFGWIDLFL
jgi:hypothetical protein